MPTSLSARLSLLEERMKGLKAGGIWVDMVDNKARVDAGTIRGKEIGFPTVFQAAKYVENRMQKATEVRGVVFVSNIADLFRDRPFIEMPSEWLKHSGVVLNLAKWVEGSIEDVAIASWNRMHPEQADIP